MKTSKPKATVFLLKQDAATTGTISEICENQQLGMQSFDSTQTLIEALNGETPSVLIASSSADSVEKSSSSLLDIKAINKELPIIVLGDPSDLNGAVTAIKAGAIDYIEKPVIAGRLKEHFRQLIRS